MLWADKHVWTQDEDALLSKMWAEGDSTSTIGRAIGVTKNSVVGRRGRLGLPPRQSPMKYQVTLDINFDQVHRMRQNRISWDNVAFVVKHPRKAVCDWYHAKCATMGVAPVMQEARSPTPATTVKRKRPSGGLRSFPLWQSPELPTALPAPISGGVLYESLPRGCCNWMLNDARPWRACGAPAGRVYCGEHTRQASARFCTRVVMVGEVAA